MVPKDIPKTATKEFKSCTLQRNAGRRAYVSKLVTDEMGNETASSYSQCGVSTTFIQVKAARKYLPAVYQCTLKGP